jgi:hypothetical protein
VCDLVNSGFKEELKLLFDSPPSLLAGSPVSSSNPPRILSVDYRVPASHFARQRNCHAAGALPQTVVFSSAATAVGATPAQVSAAASKKTTKSLARFRSFIFGFSKLSPSKTKTSTPKKTLSNFIENSTLPFIQQHQTMKQYAKQALAVQPTDGAAASGQAPWGVPPALIAKVAQANAAGAGGGGAGNGGGPGGDPANPANQQSFLRR